MSALEQIHEILALFSREGAVLNMTLDELSDIEVRLSVLGIHLADTIALATKTSLYKEGHRKFRYAQACEAFKQNTLNDKPTISDISSFATQAVWVESQEEFDAQANEKRLQVVYNMLQTTINAVKDRIKIVMAEKEMSERSNRGQ